MGARAKGGNHPVGGIADLRVVAVDRLANAHVYLIVLLHRDQRLAGGAADQQAAVAAEHDQCVKGIAVAELAQAPRRLQANVAIGISGQINQQIAEGFGRQPPQGDGRGGPDRGGLVGDGERIERRPVEVGTELRMEPFGDGPPFGNGALADQTQYLILHGVHVDKAHHRANGGQPGKARPRGSRTAATGRTGRPWHGERQP